MTEPGNIRLTIHLVGVGSCQLQVTDAQLDRVLSQLEEPNALLRFTENRNHGPAGETVIPVRSVVRVQYRIEG